MNIEHIKNLALILGVTWTSYLFYKEFSESQNKTGNKIREDYKFAKNFFEDREKNPDLHKFVIELGYLGITRERSIKSEEVEYLLSLKKPAIALFWFKKSRRYLDFSMILDQKITFKEKYKEEKFRENHKFIYLFLYYACCLLAGYRLVLQDVLPLSFLNDRHALILWIFFWLLLAWESLKPYLDMDTAEDLVRLQSGELKIKKKKSFLGFRKKNFAWINQRLVILEKRKKDRS